MNLTSASGFFSNAIVPRGEIMTLPKTPASASGRNDERSRALPALTGWSSGMSASTQSGFPFGVVVSHGSTFLSEIVAATTIHGAFPYAEKDTFSTRLLASSGKRLM